LQVLPEQVRLCKRRLRLKSSARSRIDDPRGGARRADRKHIRHRHASTMQQLHHRRFARHASVVMWRIEFDRHHLPVVEGHTRDAGGPVRWPINPDNRRSKCPRRVTRCAIKDHGSCVRRSAISIAVIAAS
jgi:hypothetical protein